MASQLTPDPLESAAPEGAEALEHPGAGFPDVENTDIEEVVAEDPEPAVERDPSVEGPTLASTGGGFTSFFLCASGFLLAAGGAALATAPYFSWHLVRIGRQFSAMGMDNGVFFIGGMVLFGLGLVFRAVHASGRATTDAGNEGQAELAFAVEEFATDLAMFRQSVLQVASQVEQLGHQQAAFCEQLQSERATAAASDVTAESDSTEQHEAMFRLAASLDQLNARVDERMHHMDVQVRGQFQGVGDAIREIREAMDERMRALSTQIQAQVRHAAPEVPPHSDAPALADLAHRHEAHEAHGVDEAPAPPEEKPEELEIVVQLEETEPDEASLEFFETLEELDEMVSGHRDAQGDAPAPALDLDELDLGELGLADDEPPPAIPDPPPAQSEDSLESLQ